MLAHCIPEPGKICENPATFNVWFEGCGGLYGFMCDEHVAKAIVDGVNGYRVYQITALNKDSQYPVEVEYEDNYPDRSGTDRNGDHQEHPLVQHADRD